MGDGKMFEGHQNGTNKRFSCRIFWKDTRQQPQSTFYKTIFLSTTTFHTALKKNERKKEFILIYAII
jgi:hypothetical protein